MDLIGYVRVSRVAGREGESFISPDVQRERIEAAAAAQGHRVVSWETDLDQPGSRYERPGFQAALEAVEQGEARGVAVAALDRFARSVPDAAVALRRLEAAGGVLISVRDALDTSTPVGRFARTMMLAIAELELERIRENWKIATERAIGRGVHITRVPPFGYQRAEDGRLTPDVETAPVLRELFLRRGAGVPWHALAAYLDERAPRPRGGAWPISTIASLVRHRAYLGEAASGEYVNRTAHPPLVSRSEWEAAQPTTGRAPVSQRGSLLTGLLRCESCGEAMTSGKEGSRGYRNYLCRERRASGVCGYPAKIGMLRLDAYVEGLFLAWLAEHPLRLLGTASNSEGEQALAAVEAAEAELVAYRDAEVVSVIGREAYLAGLRSRADVLDDARLRYTDSRRSRPSLPINIKEHWPEFSLAERQMILTEAVDVVYVSRGERPQGGGRPRVEERTRILWLPEIVGVASP